jgi:hypothetical protein
MDNNILAAGEYGLQQLKKIIDHGYSVDFNQALDARLVNKENAELLAKIHWLEHNRIRFGCDTPGQIGECEKAMEWLEFYGFHGQYFLYCMLTSNFKESYDRVMHWCYREHEARLENTGIHYYAYAQPYRDPLNPHHKIPQWQKDMAQWCNKKQLFTTISFDEFQPRKGFKCSTYKFTH